MSFSVKVKEELARRGFDSPCCRHAMCYGMLLFGKTFSSSSISLLTENKSIAEKYVSLIKDETAVEAEIIVTDAGNFKINISDKTQTHKILDAFSCSSSELKRRINRGNLQNLFQSEEIDNCCDRAFLAGAFLSCGTIANPANGYHAEFVVPHRQLSLDLLRLLQDNNITTAKHISRRGVYVVYIKDSTSIEDLLNLMGAPNCELELMDIKIQKSVINKINRTSNFEYANISRTANAAAEQMAFIEKIIEKGTFDFLPPDLQKMANIRLENPDMSLTEMGKLFDPPVSRSSINYKLRKLSDFSKKSREELLEKSVIAEEEN